MPRYHLPDAEYEAGAEKLRRKFTEYKIPLRVRDVAQEIYHNPNNTGAAENWLENAVRLGLVKAERRGKYTSYFLVAE